MQDLRMIGLSAFNWRRLCNICIAIDTYKRVFNTGWSAALPRKNAAHANQGHRSATSPGLVSDDMVLSLPLSTTRSLVPEGTVLSLPLSKIQSLE